MLANEITTTVCVSVYLSPPYQLLNQPVHFLKIQYEDIGIEGDLDAIVFNAVAATITKWRTLKL
jgi:hypothetical protein